MIEWLEENWHLAGAVAGVVVLALMPVWFSLGAGALALVIIQLPLYQVHQLEEHAGDRFRRGINDWIGGGAEVLTRQAVLVVNVLGVWAVIVAAVWLATFVDLSFGLIAMYVPIVNGLVHLAAAIVRRAYNPGLITSVVLFGGIGIPSLVVVSSAASAGILAHALGLAVAIGEHAWLALHVSRRRASLQRIGNEPVASARR